MGWPENHHHHLVSLWRSKDRDIGRVRVPPGLIACHERPPGETYSGPLIPVRRNAPIRPYSPGSALIRFRFPLIGIEPFLIVVETPITLHCQPSLGLPRNYDFVHILKDDERLVVHSHY